MEGRVVAVTGGASGIGLATAQLVASMGAKVSVADICNQDDLERALARIKESARNESDVMSCRCDVSIAEHVTGWLEATKIKWSRIDHVVNAAGVWSQSEVGKIEKVEWDHIMAVNLEGAMNVMNAAVGYMEDGAGCSIVMVSSVCGLRGVAAQAAYSASKAGVFGLVRSAAIDLGRRRIRVNCVAPGMVDTPLARNGVGEGFMHSFCSHLPIDRPADASELAKVIQFLLGPSSSFVTGSVYTVDGGFIC